MQQGVVYVGSWLSGQSCAFTAGTCTCVFLIATPPFISLHMSFFVYPPHFFFYPSFISSTPLSSFSSSTSPPPFHVLYTPHSLSAPPLPAFFFYQLPPFFLYPLPPQHRPCRLAYATKLMRSHRPSLPSPPQVLLHQFTSQHCAHIPTWEGGSCGGCTCIFPSDLAFSCPQRLSLSARYDSTTAETT